jgi:hypothetical protein
LSRQAQELAQVAIELDSEKITIIVATICGLGAGLGIPIFFVSQVGSGRPRPSPFWEIHVISSIHPCQSAVRVCMEKGCF